MTDTGPHDRPTAAELLDAVREWIDTDVAEATEGRVRYLGRVASNMLAMVERELALGPGQAEAHRRRLERLGQPDDRALAAAIRAGEYDDRGDELRAELLAATLDKLAVAHPDYAEPRHRGPEGQA